MLYVLKGMRLGMEGAGVMWSASALEKALREGSTGELVNCAGSAYGAAGLKPVFEALARNTSCKRLNLINAGVDDAAVKVLAEALKSNRGLTRLDLKQNCISDEGARALAEMLTMNTTLETLELNGNYVTDDGLKMLRDAAARNGTLTALNVENNIVDTIIGGVIGGGVVFQRHSGHASAALEDAVRNPPSALEFSHFGQAYATAEPYANISELCAGVDTIVRGACREAMLNEAQASGLVTKLDARIRAKADGRVAKGAAVAWTSNLDTDGCGERVSFYGAVQKILRTDEHGALLTETAKYARTLNLLLCGRARQGEEPGADAAEGSDFVWHFESDAGTWGPFATADSAMLEAAFQGTARELTTTDLSFNAHHKTTYTFDFNRMVQKNMHSGTARKLRRARRDGGDVRELLPDGLATYRGAWMPRLQVEWLTKGKEYRYPGYLASSNMRGKAIDFLGYSKPPPGSDRDVPVLFVFTFDADKGCKHVNLLENITEVPGEQEWLFQHYSAFQVEEPADLSGNAWDEINPVIVQIAVVADNSQASLSLPLATHH